jgi:hypothetical protein
MRSGQHSLQEARIGISLEGSIPKTFFDIRCPSCAAKCAAQKKIVYLYKESLVLRHIYIMAHIWRGDLPSSTLFDVSATPCGESYLAIILATIFRLAFSFR